MTSDEAKHVVGAVEETFGSKYPATARRLMWPEIEKASYQAGEMTGDHIILNNTRLPPPAVFIETLKRMQAEVSRKSSQELEQQAAKDKTEKTFDYNEVKPSSKLGQDAILGIKMILNKSSDDDMREFFMAMGQRHGDRWYKVGDDVMNQRKTGKGLFIEDPNQKNNHF